MHRGIDRDEGRSAREESDRGGPNRDDKTVQQKSRSGNERDRHAVGARDRTYHVSADERAMMKEIGRFRAIELKDLERLQYDGNASRLNQDIRSLQKQGLLQTRTLWLGRDREKTTVAALTKEGKRLMEKDTNDGQRLYAGFVKPAEIRHDAALYRMYHAEKARLEKRGARLRRVVLDYELKQKIYSPLAKARPAASKSEFRRRQQEVAEAHGLKVIQGRILLPDLRIEYETRDGQVRHADLEYASENYHGSHAAWKAEAGFTLYASGATRDRLAGALEERDIIAEIFAL